MRRYQPQHVVNVAADGHDRRRGPRRRSKPPAAQRRGVEEKGGLRITVACSTDTGRWRNPIPPASRRVLYARHRRRGGGDDSRRRTPPEERRWRGEGGERAGGVALGVIEGVGVVRKTARRVALALPSETEAFE